MHFCCITPPKLSFPIRRLAPRRHHPDRAPPRSGWGYASLRTSSATSCQRSPSARTTAATAAHNGSKHRSGFSRYISSCPGSQLGGLAKKSATVGLLLSSSSDTPVYLGDDDNSL